MNVGIQAKKIEIAKDYAIGLNSPSHIIEKYFKVFDLTQNGYVDFKLFPRQREIIKAYVDNRHNLVTKPRQAGVSTTTAAYLAVKAAYADKSRPEVIIIMANKFASAKKFLGVIRKFLANVPRFMWGDNFQEDKTIDGHIVGKGSTETLELVNGTIIKAVATSPDALRGWTPTHLVFDEAAFIDTYPKELYAASVASTITGGKMIQISTPNGKDELYYETYRNAINGDNNFNIVSMKWYEDPRYNKDLKWVKKFEDGTEDTILEKDFNFKSYTEKVKKGYKPISTWYLDMCKSLNNDKLSIARELDVKFEGSAGNVIEYKYIEEQLNKNVCEPIEKKFRENRLWVFEKPILGARYIMGVDVSSGNSKDFTGLAIINVDTGDTALELKVKIRPEELAPNVHKLSLEYNCMIVIDATGGYGDVLIHELKKLNNKFIYYSKPETAGIKIGNARPKIIAKFTSYVEQMDLIIKSKRLIVELETFVWVNNRPDHQKGANDDLIFAYAIAIWVIETSYKKMEAVNKINKNIMNFYDNVLSNKNLKINKPKGHENSWLFR